MLAQPYHLPKNASKLNLAHNPLITNWFIWFRFELIPMKVIDLFKLDLNENLVNIKLLFHIFLYKPLWHNFIQPIKLYYITLYKINLNKIYNSIITIYLSNCGWIKYNLILRKDGLYLPNLERVSDFTPMLIISLPNYLLCLILVSRLNE